MFFIPVSSHTALKSLVIEENVNWSHWLQTVVKIVHISYYLFYVHFHSIMVVHKIRWRQDEAMPSNIQPHPGGGEHLHKHLLIILLFRPDPLPGSASISGYSMSVVSWIEYHSINVFFHFAQSYTFHQKN